MNGLLQYLPEEASLDDIVLAPILFAGVIIYLTNGKLWNKPDPFEYKWYERPQDEFVQALAPTRTRNIAHRLEETHRDLVIFWGSQSGTAEGYAHRLSKDLSHKLQLHSVVADLSDYDAESITNIPASKFAIFLISTYGEGDPSDNAMDFMAWLKSRPKVSLESLRYAAIGFGNSNYKYYNKVVEDLSSALESVGASSLLPIAKADEALRTTSEDYIEWKNKLYSVLTSELGYQEQASKYEPALRVVHDRSSPTDGLEIGMPIPNRVYKRGLVSEIASFPILERRDLVTDEAIGGSCMHLELDLSAHPEIKYKSGDHIAVWPSNPTEEVARLLKILNLTSKSNQPIQIEALDAEEDLKLPRSTTISALFTHYLEICAPVPRETLHNLAGFTISPTVQRELSAIASSRATYAAFLSKNHLTFARLLEYATALDPECSWAMLPLPFVIESIPPMTPRYYSISSSSVTTPRRVAITCSVKPTMLPDTSVAIPGLTSTYLSTGAVHSRLHAQIRRSDFKLPVNAKVPLVMVAAGSGIAPMRAFLLDRARLANVGQSVGKMLLFFGCRNADADYLYSSELRGLASGPLKDRLEIVAVFSREERKEKKYVQHAVDERIEAVVQLLLEGEASYYVCGSTKMAKEVERVIGAGIQRHSGWDAGELARWRAAKKKIRRWNEDVWG